MNAWKTLQPAAPTSKPKSVSLVWFRSDLRLKDNAALSQATYSREEGVLAVFVVSKNDWIRHDWGAVKVDFIKRNLKALEVSLSKCLNVRL